MALPITTTSGGAVQDSSGNTWTLTVTGNLIKNGVAVSGGSGTAQLTSVSGVIWAQDGASHIWYTWDGANFIASNSQFPPPTPVAAPTPLPIPTPVPAAPTPVAPTPASPSTVFVTYPLTTTGTQLLITGLQADTAYDFEIIATNNAGSNTSSIISITTTR